MSSQTDKLIAMAFVLTLLYIAITLVSPGALPTAIASLHISIIVGMLVILTLPFDMSGSKLEQRPETYLGFGLLVATCLSMLATGWFGGTIASFLDFAPILITFYFVAITCHNLTRIRILVFVMVAVAFYIFSQGLIAEHTGNFTSPYLETENILDTSVFRYRGMGVVSDPNDLAQVFVALIPLLWLRWKKGSHFSNFLFTIIPAVILAVGVYFTHSRGGAIALVAVVMFGFKDKLGVVGSGILAAISLVAMLVLGIAGGRGIGEDDGGRVAAWATGLETMKTHPILGIGPGNFVNYNPTGHTAHNSFILAMTELGFVGYFFWMGMIVCSWSGLSQIIRAKLAKTVPEKKSSFPNRMPSPIPERISSSPLGLVQASAGAAGMMTHSIAKPSFQFPEKKFNRPGGNSASIPMYMENLASKAEPDVDELAYAARIIRIAFVGLLTAAFFLSRTYAVTLYIMLGMAVAVIKMPAKPFPSDFPSLAKKTVAACFFSVIFLYLFVRLHGGK